VAARHGELDRRDLPPRRDQHRRRPVDWEALRRYGLHGCDHPRIHGGEIAVLKGLQGGVGWIEPDEFRAAVTVEELDG
jgi:hypothetical protein